MVMASGTLASACVATLLTLSLALSTNPTHYGDPKTGCKSDEQAVQVTGVSGDFCSPACTSSSCPTDVPAGIEASPMCALQTSTGDKYCALICSADSDCGTGSCQTISGVGICTYAAPAFLDVAAADAEVFLSKQVPVIPSVAAEAQTLNQTHYADPKVGCLPDEQDLQVPNVPGVFCSPSCTSRTCPTDMPSAMTASPVCALQAPDAQKYCVLFCSSNSQCGTGSCHGGGAFGSGICTYQETSLATKQLAAKQYAAASRLQAVLAEDFVGTNPTHYGDPHTGCKSDEQTVQVSGVPGDFCSAVCQAGKCPTDVPAGVNATGACALQSEVGDNFCALLCDNKTKTCGSGTCRDAGGVGICTYPTPSALLGSGKVVVASVRSSPSQNLMV